MTAEPLLVVTRGPIVESIHYGSIAIAEASGKQIASQGDPQTVAFLRSSAKPFQALPFVERGGVEQLGFTPRELALACASHEGSRMHLQAVRELQQKIGVRESDLQCGTHLPGDVAELTSLIVHARKPTPNHNNCSGKHTAMLAHAKMRGLPLETYLDLDHPVQQDILAAFSEMCRVPAGQVQVGTDGCSAPNFAIPLFQAALGFARLCDPGELPERRASACRKITSAMTGHPEMVSGYGEFDEQLMRVGGGKIVCKRGAEGYQIVGLLPGTLGAGSPGFGIAIKVSDGDPARLGSGLESTNRVRPAVTLEILRQLGVLTPQQEQALAGFGPAKSITNHRGIVTGKSYPVFKL